MAIATGLGGGPPRKCARFGTGTQHFVFDTVLCDGAPLVLRLSRPADRHLTEGAMAWSERLCPRGVALPQILHADPGMDRHPCPYVVLERLRGVDLGDVLDALPPDRMRAIAGQLAEAQARVAALPRGRGYGFVTDPEAVFPHNSWTGVLEAELTRSRRRIAAAGAVPPDRVDRAEAALRRFFPALDDIPPVPFLHDITTRNVIVDDGHFSGIVDVDDLCYGDPLYLPALIRMALFAHDRPLGYFDAWRGHLALDGVQPVLLDLYTLIHCVGFLSELGTRFNRARAEPVDPGYRARLLALFDGLEGALPARAPHRSLAH